MLPWEQHPIETVQVCTDQATVVTASPLLPQLFQVAYILIKFANSPRPDLWVLERSVDFGNTYSPWQYFARK